MSRENTPGGSGELNGRKRRLAAPSAIAITVGLLAFAGFAQTPALAVDDQQLQLLSDQIRQLQAQIDSLKKAQAAQSAAPSAAQTAAIGNNKPAYGYETGSHQFGWASADGQNSIELTGRLHFDVGSYINYKPNAGLVNPAELVSGANARRARIGVTGKFAGDFVYTIIGEFGGTSDTQNPFASGFTASGLENAYFTYNGLNKPDHTVPLAFDLGYLDVPFTLDESISSNDTMFMERSSSQVVAVALGGGDNRSAFGARSYKTNYWAGAYVTGPTSGTAHNDPTTANANQPQTFTPSGEPLAFLGRATYNPYQDADGNNIHVGLNGGIVVNPGSTVTNTAGVAPAAGVTGHSLTLGDRPELRLDPTQLLTTGAITNVSGADVIGGELAGQFDHFFAQGEYYEYLINRYANAAAPQAADLNFNGGYVQASWSIGGKRKYNASTGAYTGVIPDAPLSLKEGGGFGAVELAARFSTVDLNSKWSPNVATPALGQPGIEGGQQTTYTVGINYYPNSNMRVMLNYLHTDLSRLSTAAASVPNGASIDAIAGRFQVSF